MYSSSQRDELLQSNIKKERIEFRLSTEPAYFVYVGALFLPYLNKTGYPNKRDNDAAYCLVKSDWSNP